MYDLIYGGNEYKDELLSLFSDAIIENASDDIHQDRISITIKGIDEKEYRKKIILNGFHEMSLYVQTIMLDKEYFKILEKEIEEWKTTDPEYFK